MDLQWIQHFSAYSWIHGVPPELRDGHTKLGASPYLQPLQPQISLNDLDLCPCLLAARASKQKERWKASSA